MKSELLTPVTITDRSLYVISNLLISSWSAEYALRITPLLDGEAYRESSLLWSFPQTYYGSLFSFRAVLETLGCQTADQAILVEDATALFHHGLYAGTNLTDDYLTRLQQLCNPHKMEQEMAGHSALNIADMLLNVLEQVATVHEAHILSVIGWDAYTSIIDSAPPHLQDSFVLERSRALLEMLDREEVLA